MASLEILSGALAGQRLTLSAGRYSVGSGATSRIWFSEQGVSTRHAQLWEEEGVWWVECLSGAGQTLLNAAPVRRARIRTGDELGFGPVRVRFVETRPPPPVPPRWAPEEETLTLVDGGPVPGHEEEGSLRARLEAATRRLREGADWQARHEVQRATLATLREENAALKERLVRQKEEESRAVEVALREARAHAEARAALERKLVARVDEALASVGRNTALLQGYLQECALLARCVRQIDYTRLEPPQQRMLCMLLDELQPEIVLRNMEQMRSESQAQAAQARALLSGWQEEEGRSLQRCFEWAKALMGEEAPAIRWDLGTASLDRAWAPWALPLACVLLDEAREAAALWRAETPTLRAEAAEGGWRFRLGPVGERVGRQMDGGARPWPEAGRLGVLRGARRLRREGGALFLVYSVHLPDFALPT